jgi:hypothetical protein
MKNLAHATNVGNRPKPDGYRFDDDVLVDRLIDVQSSSLNAIDQELACFVCTVQSHLWKVA